MNHFTDRKELENDFIKFWIKDAILYSKYKKPIEITMKNVNIFITLRHKISDNKKQYWCCDITNLKFYTKEAQNYAEVHGQDYLHACAVIVKSHVAKFIFNSFALFRKVIIPFRAFTTKEKAIAWLNELKKNNKH